MLCLCCFLLLLLLLLLLLSQAMKEQYSELARDERTDSQTEHKPEHGEQLPEDSRKTPGCCARCRFALSRKMDSIKQKLDRQMDYEIRGFRLPQFLGLTGSLVLPTADAWLDWSVTITWYLNGDVHWAEAGLSINLLSGALSGLLLGAALTKHPKTNMPAARAYPLGVLLGLPGLAPVAWAAVTLYEEDTDEGPLGLKFFKAAELVFESLPQSVLQCVAPPPPPAPPHAPHALTAAARSRRTYVGVAYGKFDPSGPRFSWLLPVSVCDSLLGAGSTVFSF